MKSVVIVGGGLAGLLTAHALAQKGISSTLIEKKEYPFHRVCGEYISEETVPYLEHLGLFPKKFNPPRIRQLQLTSVSGRSAVLPLDLGGFGISRFAFDLFLFEKLPKDLVLVKQNTEVTTINFKENRFVVSTDHEQLEADVIIAANGKRSKLDATLKRPFLTQRSPYVGVKYHVRSNHPANVIALHNFKDGYCGMSNVEDNISNLCYLTHRNNLKQHGTIAEMEKNVLFRNPYLKSIFTESEFLFEKPEVINEISFATKAPVENHILMCGDAAGMITPLCGNGMAIAIHSSKLLTEAVAKFCRNEIDREAMERTYDQRWKNQFAKRLWAGRKIQQLFGSETASNLAVNLARYVKPVANFLISKTHGQPF